MRRLAPRAALLASLAPLAILGIGAAEQETAGSASLLRPARVFDGEAMHAGWSFDRHAIADCRVHRQGASRSMRQLPSASRV